jgi:hypothetical protein
MSLVVECQNGPLSLITIGYWTLDVVCGNHSFIGVILSLVTWMLVVTVYCWKPSVIGDMLVVIICCWKRNVIGDMDVSGNSLLLETKCHW